MAAAIRARSQTARVDEQVASVAGNRGKGRVGVLGQGGGTQSGARARWQQWLGLGLGGPSGLKPCEWVVSICGVRAAWSMEQGAGTGGGGGTATT